MECLGYFRGLNIFPTRYPNDMSASRANESTSVVYVGSIYSHPELEEFSSQLFSRRRNIYEVVRTIYILFSPRYIDFCSYSFDFVNGRYFIANRGVSFWFQ